jgi:hypothetical protein
MQVRIRLGYWLQFSNSVRYHKNIVYSTDGPKGKCAIFPVTSLWFIGDAFPAIKIALLINRDQGEGQKLNL